MSYSFQNDPNDEGPDKLSPQTGARGTSTIVPGKSQFISVSEQYANVSTGGLQVNVDVRLMILNQTHGSLNDTVFSSVIEDVTRDVFTRYTTRNVLMKSKQTSSSICRKIVDGLQTQCCKVLLDCSNFTFEADLTDTEAEEFDKLLRYCKNDCRDFQIQTYLLFTKRYRKHLAEEFPIVTRVQDMFDRYPLLRSKDQLLVNLVTTINVNTGSSLASANRLTQNVLNMTNIILDYVFSSNLAGEIQRSSLKTEDQRVLYAFSMLSTIFQEEETVEKDKDLPKIIQEAKGESWLDEAQRHAKTSTPWILHHEHQNSSFIAIMIGERVLVNVTSASESIMGLMGVFYFTFLPYPPQHSGTFLFIKSQILEDIIDSAYLSEVKRLKQILGIQF